MKSNAEIDRLTREIQAICGELPMGKRLQVLNRCRRIRLRSKGLPDIEPAPKTGEVSQKEMILEYMRLGNPITQLEALRHFGCGRLGARIWDIRHDKKDPKEVATEWINDKSTGKRYASYTLIEQ